MKKFFLFLPILALLLFASACHTGRLSLVPANPRTSAMQTEKHQAQDEIPAQKEQGSVIVAKETVEAEQAATWSCDNLVPTETNATELDSEKEANTLQIHPEKQENDQFKSLKKEKQTLRDRSVNYGILLIVVGVIFGLMGLLMFYNSGVLAMILGIVFLIAAGFYLFYGILTVILARNRDKVKRE